MDTVTVLIAAYNAEAFLHRAVNSALAQTLPPFEILIIDDASTDNTVAVANRLGQANPSVRVISLTENGGPSKARNAGLDAARGDWVAIVDADDAILPERLERMIDIGNRKKADIVADNFLWYDAKTDTIGTPGISTSLEIEMVDIYRFAAQAMPYTNEMDWGLLQPVFRRDFLSRHKLRYPVFSRHGEDFLLMLYAFMAGARYALVRIPGYLYTHRSSGFSRTKIDYDGMAAYTASLLGQDGIRIDEKLKRLLQKRVDALRRLAAEYRLRQLLDKRDFKEIALTASVNWRFCKAIIHFGWHKLKNQVRKIK